MSVHAHAKPGSPMPSVVAWGDEVFEAGPRDILRVMLRQMATALAVGALLYAAALVGSTGKYSIVSATTRSASGAVTVAAPFFTAPMMPQLRSPAAFR